jgi:hypothetical protein
VIFNAFVSIAFVFMALALYVVALAIYVEIIALVRLAETGRCLPRSPNGAVCKPGTDDRYCECHRARGACAPCSRCVRGAVTD